ncbi:hypothetical protein D3C87_1768370 [compost metagenome]
MPWIGRTSTFGIERAARPKFVSISAPPITSALDRSSLPKCPSRTLVFGSDSLASSMMMMPPVLALDESAWRRASARTFLGRS